MSFNTFNKWVKRSLRFTGRVGVSEYIVFLLIVVGFGQLLAYYFARGDRTTLLILLSVAAILMWPILAVTVRRLHDLNLSACGLYSLSSSAKYRSWVL